MQIELAATPRRFKNKFLFASRISSSIQFVYRCQNYPQLNNVKAAFKSKKKLEKFAVAVHVLRKPVVVLKRTESGYEIDQTHNNHLNDFTRTRFETETKAMFPLFFLREF